MAAHADPEGPPSVLSAIRVQLRPGPGGKLGAELGDGLSLKGARPGSAAEAAGLGEAVQRWGPAAFCIAEAGGHAAPTRDALQHAARVAAQHGTELALTLLPQLTACCDQESWRLRVAVPSPLCCAEWLRGELERMQAVPAHLQELLVRGEPLAEGRLDEAGVVPGSEVVLRLRRTAAAELQAQLTRRDRCGRQWARAVARPPWEDDCALMLPPPGCAAAAAAAAAGGEGPSGLIAEGTYGQVWRCRRRADGAALAVKRVLQQQCTAYKGARRLLCEAAVGQGARHPNLMPCLEVRHCPEAVYFIMPLFDGADLVDTLSQRGATPAERKVPAAQAAGVVRGVMRGLEHLHALGVAHRDVKPENVMVPPSLDHAVLIDFGLCKWLRPPDAPSPSPGAWSGAPTVAQLSMLSSSRAEQGLEAPPLSAVAAAAAAAVAAQQYLLTPGMHTDEYTTLEALQHFIGGTWAGAAGAEGAAVAQRRDLHGAGAVAYTMLCGEAPFSDPPSGGAACGCGGGEKEAAGKRWETAALRAQRMQREGSPAALRKALLQTGAPADATELVCRLLDPDGACPPAAEALRHEWLTQPAAQAAACAAGAVLATAAAAHPPPAAAATGDGAAAGARAVAPRRPVQGELRRLAARQQRARAAGRPRLQLQNAASPPGSPEAAAAVAGQQPA
eukprot:TRINITY_DN15037_c0_g1_i3.p1 TRINITY_DN15037_c0_g1~~TRINITY_DN15037_c0_g1_i3.p1  ORF type:complete len:702 (+),score=228.86 TRINITY_DN15037_c0_g1_i3:85-2106(+)